MSQQFHRPSTGDTKTVPDALVDRYKADPAWEPAKATTKTTAAPKEKS